MDETGRKITKIAREVNKITVQTMKEDGIGTAEFDFIHLIRHNPEAKGYLIRKPNPDDGRSQMLYATQKAEKLKNSKAYIEGVFYEWLLAELPEEEKEAFCKTLDTLYWRSKRQSRAGFPDVSALIDKGGEGREE